MLPTKAQNDVTTTGQERRQFGHRLGKMRVIGRFPWGTFPTPGPFNDK